MAGNEHLTVGEFERGIRRIEVRFDHFEEKFSDHEGRLAVLEDSEKDRSRRQARKNVTWGSAAATACVAVFEGVRYLLSR